MLKIILTLLVTASCGFAFAKDGKKNMNMDERKAKITENIDKRIASLNELKSCISGASEKSAMKKCREAHQGRVKSLKPSRKQ